MAVQGKVNATEIWVSLYTSLSSEPSSCLLGAREDKRGVCCSQHNLWYECPCAFRTCLNLSFFSSLCSRLGEVCSADQSPDKQQGRPAAAGSQRAKRRERAQALPPGRGKDEGLAAYRTPHFSGAWGWENGTKQVCWLGGDSQGVLWLLSWLGYTPRCVTLGKWSLQLCTLPCVEGTGDSSLPTCLSLHGCQFGFLKEDGRSWKCYLYKRDCTVDHKQFLNLSHTYY